MHLHENTFFDLGPRSNENLYHVTYAATKFEVATSNGLIGDTFTRNMTFGRTYRRTDGLRDEGPTLVRN